MVRSNKPRPIKVVANSDADFQRIINYMQGTTKAQDTHIKSAFKQHKRATEKK